MLADDETRWTAYSDDVPAGHGATKEEALAEAERRLRPGVTVTRVVLRLRAYPFTRLREEKP